MSLNVVSNESRASVKVISQGSSLPVVALLWPVEKCLFISPLFHIPNGKGSVSRKQDVSPGKSKMCPKAVKGKLLSQPPSDTSSQVKRKSHSGLLFQRKLSARHGNLSWGLWLSWMGCKVHRSQHCALLSLCPLYFLCFEGIEAGSQHYLKRRCQVKSSSF